MDINSKQVTSAKIHFRKLSETQINSDGQKPRRAAAIIECYEMPVYVSGLTILIMTAMVVLGIFWAALAKVDVIAEAPGSIIPIGNVKLIQPAVDGVLEKILVVEGEQVRKGQPLVILASTSYPDTLSLSEQLEHLSDERADRLGSLKSRISELDSKKSEFIMQCKEKQSELTSSQLELEKMRSILTKSQRQAKAYKAVYEEGGFSMVDYLQAEKTFEKEQCELIKEKANAINIASQIDTLNSKLTQLESQITSEILEKQAQVKDLSFQIETVRMKLHESDRHFRLAKAHSSATLLKTKTAPTKENIEINDGNESITKRQSENLQTQDSEDQSEINAPVNGTVTAIKMLGHGQVVSKGQTLMVIVPADCPLIVEARLPNKDIGFVRTGQRARLKLAAFPYQDYGILEGTVTEIEKYPQEDEKHNSFYKVTIVPKQDWIMVAGKKIRFSNGAALTAEITIRRKSVLNIILDPIKKAADIHWVG